LIIPKKRFGQNFLKDEAILYKIIESIPHSDRVTVEIGSGLGDLTQKLLEQKKRVIAFEVDRDLCKILKEKFQKEIENKTLELNCGDVLKEWEGNNLVKEEYDLVANLPYYIATNIVLKALTDNHCKSITVMVQKEVALKFVAKPKDRNFSALSILANSTCKTKILFDVEAEKFYPPPKVTSSVLQIVKEKELISEEKGVFRSYEEFVEFENFLKESFKAPRKTLLKNLSKKYDRKLLEEFFRNYDIASAIRPHELDLSLYHLLFKKLNK